MHVATKDTSKDGKTHLLTTLLEADGAFELAQPEQVLTGEVVSVKRTSSGGIEITTALRIDDPQPAEEAEPSAQ